ncbi:hypothetical protein [Phaeobacter sp. HF9A]|uniref:hypothetical protein n=1 Tax=Phaeobacter sp. HF9A TaxID=2721561 RepID=UPI0014317DD8|nr:hypothetical protein [Phaeobacter sp. HF9A]NIZ12022.1 hypothetical protein [Phaeobacter sp. HF9A]
MRIETQAGLTAQITTQQDDSKKSGAKSTGSAAASGPVPDADSAQRPSYASMLEGLAAFAPTDLGTDFESRLAEIAQKMQDAKGEADLDRLSNEQEAKRQQIQENREKLDSAQGKMDDAEVAHDTGRVSSIVGSIAAAVGAAAMIAVGTVVAAVPGLQVLGGAMVVGGIFMAASAINGMVAGASDSGMGLSGTVLEAMGVDRDTAAALDMAANITLAVGALASSVVGAALSGGAAAPAAIASAITLVNAVNAAVAGTSAVATSTVNLVANAIKSDATEMRAQTQETQAAMQQGDDLIDQVMEFVAKSNEQFNALLDSITSLQRDTGDSLSRTRFAG